MSCHYLENCGGCPQRNKELSAYRQEKQDNICKVLGQIKQTPLPLGETVFIGDATRRRASLAFSFRKGKLTFGFNGARSNDIVDIGDCPLLMPELNDTLPKIRSLLEQICAIPYKIKNGKKMTSHTLSGGDVWLCAASNGVDVVLEYDAPLDLEHRMVIFEMAQAWDNIIRISHRRRLGETPEPIIEKAKPFVQMEKYSVYIPGATFLQPSFAGEQALAGLVLKYLGNVSGYVADLFCGVGTFSYYIASVAKVKILASDSSEELLSGFQESVNRNQITNIEIKPRNLFKYPLDVSELSSVDAVVIDPPRAGAAAQVGKIAAFADENKPQKIVFVSCNPHTFVNDANTLLAVGYKLSEVTIVDQFVYSNHSEVVALFTKE